MGITSGFITDDIVFVLFWFVGFFFCRNEEFRKKASISFGIQFDNHKYGLLENCLDEILIHKDRVSCFIELSMFELYK